MSIWAQKYLGIPFKDRGDTRKGCDCWGLCILVLKEERGMCLPAYEEIPPGADVEKAAQFLKSRTETCWQKIERGNEQPFDVALMKGVLKLDDKTSIAPIHIGCVVEQGKLIHIEQGCDVTIVGYSHPRMQRRIIDFYRFLG